MDEFMIKLLSGKLNQMIADFNAIDRHKMRSEKKHPLCFCSLSQTQRMKFTTVVALKLQIKDTQDITAER